jgi:hypothetical protein
MQYLLMIYGNEQEWANLPAPQREKMSKDFMTYSQEIVKSGHFRAGSQLQPVASATTLRTKGGKVVTSDGPFAETKEQLGGYYLVECKDLDEALSLGKRIPSLPITGSVEVRPLVPMSQPLAAK